MHHFSFYLYSVQTSNFATWSGFNIKTNVEVVLFKWENLIKTIWRLSVTYIAGGNHLGSLSYRQLLSMSCEMQLFHLVLVLHPPWSIDHFAKHKKSLSFGTHQWCFLTSAINDPQAYTRRRVFHLGIYSYVFFLFSCINTIFFGFNWIIFIAILF